MRRIKWSRGFFRLWLIASFILVTILFIANRPILNFIQHVEGKNEYTKALNAIEVPEGTYDFNGAIREGLETADLVDYFSSDTELSALVSNIEVFEDQIEEAVLSYQKSIYHLEYVRNFVAGTAVPFAVLIIWVIATMLLKWIYAGFFPNKND